MVLINQQLNNVRSRKRSTRREDAKIDLTFPRTITEVVLLVASNCRYAHIISFSQRYSSVAQIFIYSASRRLLCKLHIVARIGITFKDCSLKAVRLNCESRRW
ncbi:hypothetical protein ACS0PU_006640 [Formica fusca]